MKIDMNSIIALSEFAMAIGTFVMAYYTRQTLIQSNKEKKRNRTIELIRFIIASFIEQLNVEITYLKKKLYNFTSHSEKIDFINPLEVSKELSIIFNDFIENFRTLYDEIQIRNKKRLELEEKIKEIYNFIRVNTDFINRVRKLIEKWNVETNQNKTFSDEEILILISYIIDNRKELPYANSRWYEFWKIYGNELLGLRNSKEIKEKLEEVSKLTRDLLKISENIKLELEKIRDNYRKEYDLLLVEILPITASHI